MTDVEAAEAAVIQAVVTFANDLLAGKETHTGQIENQVAALIEAVRRDERASMPCYGEAPMPDGGGVICAGCRTETGDSRDGICLTCAARAERDGGTG